MKTEQGSVRFVGRRMSAVDQGYRYAINLPCDWVIVTSIRQTRLYYKGCDQHTYEQFDTGGWPTTRTTCGGSCSCCVQDGVPCQSEADWM